jgi:hypothetical protein
MLMIPFALRISYLDVHPRRSTMGFTTKYSTFENHETSEIAKR